MLFRIFVRRCKKPPSPKPKPSAETWATSEALFSHLVASGRAFHNAPSPSCQGLGFQTSDQNQPQTQHQSQEPPPRLARHSSLNLSSALQTEQRLKSKEKLSYGALDISAPSKPPHRAPRHTPGLPPPPHPRLPSYESLAAPLAPALAPGFSQRPTGVHHTPGAVAYQQAHARHQRGPTAAQDVRTRPCWHPSEPSYDDRLASRTAASGAAACLRAAGGESSADPETQCWQPLGTGSADLQPQTSNGAARALPHLQVSPLSPSDQSDSLESPWFPSTGSAILSPEATSNGMLPEVGSMGTWVRGGPKPLRPPQSSERVSPAKFCTNAEAVTEAQLSGLDEEQVAGGAEASAQRSTTCPNRRCGALGHVRPARVTSPREGERTDRAARGIETVEGVPKSVPRGSAPLKTKLRTMVRKLSRWSSLPAGVEVLYP